MTAKSAKLLVAATFAALSACSTPESRIHDSPQLFAQATPEQQRLIRAGEVGLGFTPGMVKLAMGDPDRITEDQTIAGTRLIWHYEGTPNYTYVAGGYGWGYGGPWYYGGAFAPVTIIETTGAERDKLRVVFQDNKVVGIQRLVKGD